MSKRSPVYPTRDVYIKRFWSYVDRRGVNECWEWQKGKDYYGFIVVRARKTSSHRFAYEARHGEGSAKGFFICHKCDNPLCCNPNHLFKGTPGDNTRDMVSKGRNNPPRGSDSHFAKLDETIVKNIRKSLKSGVRQIRLAEKYNVCRGTMSMIASGKIWKHV